MSAMPGTPAADSPGNVPNAPLAPENMRLAARVMDIVICYPVTMALGLSLSAALGWSGEDPYEVGTLLAIVLWACSITVYFVYPTARYGRTLGKRFFGIKVVRTVTEVPIGLPRAFAREVCALATMFVPFLFLIMRLDPHYRQCLHDKLADSTVVWVGRSSSRPRRTVPAG
jgi:uncharacterized RDD family membrane protein YckC